MDQGRDKEKRLTSEDLFGDLVDAPGPGQPTQPEPEPRPSAGPIKVKVSEPSVIAKPVPALPEELSALVDAFDDGSRGHAPESSAPADAPAAGDSEQQLEAMSELVQLTSKLPAVPSETTLPGANPPELDLAQIAERAFTDPGAKADATIPFSPEPPGLRYGPYRLLEKIATGGMAEVFKAKRTGVAGFEKIVAVKRILPHLSFNKEFVEMFVDEAKMVAELQHPNIVQIFDLGRIGSSYYLAMEYVPGADLRSILRQLKERSLRMPLDLALFVTSRVAAGLDHAHRKKDALGRPVRIVHRDVSPQNILISYDGEVKLADFGIAKAATKASTTEKGALRGKLMYMSPEQASAKAIDHRSDIFALGIVLYELVTDERPFVGDSEMSVLDKVRRGRVAPPSTLLPEIPPAIEKLILKMLEKEPRNRPRDAASVHQELEAILQDSSHTTTAKDLSRFVRILFDRMERSDTTDEKHEGSGPQIEVDLGPLEKAAPAEERLWIMSPMSPERLLKRFGPG